jgi:hypothetical protein
MSSYAIIYPMEEQKDFLNILSDVNSGQPKVSDAQIVPEPSVEEQILQGLLGKKKVLEDEIFACIYCNHSSPGTCDHDSEMAELMRDIDEAELNAREK